jgi:acetyl-CoA C-acetyltransferase
MHAIATVATELRNGVGKNGLVWANGGYTTKHAFGVYSTQAPTKPFQYDYPQDQIDALPSRTLATPTDAAGPATVEAYSVMHDRDGNPERSILSCLLADGRRAWADTTDVALGRDMCENEWVGQSVTLDASGTLLA